MERVIDIRDLDAVVSAKFTLDEAEARCFYGNTERLVETTICAGTMQRLMAISDATRQGIFTGERNEDGTPFTKYLMYKGCRFWAPATLIL